MTCEPPVPDEMNALRGRVQALELVVTALLTAHITQHFQPTSSSVDALEREMFESMQYVERGIDPDSDEAWASVLETLRRLFANVRLRFKANGR